MPTTPQPKARRGFTAMSPETQHRITSMGGKAAHALGTAHEYTSEEARIAGRKGGKIIGANRLHMRQIGRVGGKSKGRRRVQKEQE